MLKCIRGVIMLSVVGLMACNSNPYTSSNGEVLSPAKPQNKVVEDVIVIDMPTVVKMTEGTPGQIPVSGRVPSGKPIVTFENLPAGAVYDAKQGLILWTPDMNAANDPGDPTITQRAYTFTATLRSSDSHIISYKQKEITIIVYDKAQGVQLSGFEATETIPEGSILKKRFQVQSKDFPNGPFVVSGEGTPTGVAITPTADPTQFQISYAPGLTTVTASNYGQMCHDLQHQAHFCRDFSWSVQVLDPRGNRLFVQTRWTVMDMRQIPLIVVPTTVAGGNNVADFYIQVEDPNGEAIPVVKTSVNVPGKATMTTVASSDLTNNSNPYAMVHVVWAPPLPPPPPPPAPAPPVAAPPATTPPTGPPGSTPPTVPPGQAATPPDIAPPVPVVTPPPPPPPPPPSLAGTTKTYTFDACVLGTSGNADNCKTISVQVNF